MAGVPVVFLVPFLVLRGVGRRVGGQHEIGGAALAAVADGAAEFLHRMRAVGIDEQIEPRMGGELRDLTRREAHGAGVVGSSARIEAEVLALVLALLHDAAGRPPASSAATALLATGRPVP